jgi:hypothetical protein
MVIPTEGRHFWTRLGDIPAIGLLGRLLVLAVE